MSTNSRQGRKAGLRSWWDRQVETWSRWIDRLPDRGFTARILAAAGLTLVAIGVLIVLNMALRSWGLWGDLAFALVVVTAVLWVLYRATRPLLRRDRRYWPLPRALSMAIVLLIGLPVAIAVGWLGYVLLAVPVVVWVGVAIARRFGAPLPGVPLWPLAIVGVGIMLAVIAVRPTLTPAETVPRAVPAAQEDRRHGDIAEEFRPFLFFDLAEQLYPIDIEQSIDEGRVRSCRPVVHGDGCTLLTAAADLDDNAAYLAVAEPLWRARGGDDRSAIYYRVDPAEPPRYVDYWFYYAHNPTPVAGDVFCGPGFRTPPFTCQEHEGDWEGITVLLDPCEAESETCRRFAGGLLLTPRAVRYAQHAHVVQYPWSDLERMWANLPEPTSPSLVPVWDEFVRPAAANHGPRPLAFPARDSHATYPRACLGNCQQTGVNLPEARHNGGQPWAHNLECDDCVKPLPLTADGEPALWNAFSGRWGAQRCILAGAYCDFSAAPRSPSRQGRYRDPLGEQR